LLLDSSIFGNGAAVANTSPAGLLNGVSAAATAATGGGDSAMVKDIEAIFAALATAGAGVAPVFVAAPGQAAAIKCWAGPNFTYPVLPSAAVAAGTLIAVEAPSFVFGYSSVPTFDASHEGVYHMEDTSPAQFAVA